MVDDIDDMAAEDLLDIFDAMETYYTIGEGWNHKEAPELWSLFDYLAEVFGKPSDFAMTDEELQDLYNQIKYDSLPDDTFLEGQKIEDFGDLVDMERRERDSRINDLLNELY